MIAELKKTYFVFLIPSIMGFILVYGAKACDLFRIEKVENVEIVAPFIFISCTVLAIALPIFCRTIFAHKNRDKVNVSEVDLIKFERYLIRITMVTPYLALSAYVLELSHFYTSGAFLMGLYAIYYFYPSEKRLALDRCIFRVK